jgi:glutaredoxin
MSRFFVQLSAVVLITLPVVCGQSTSIERVTLDVYVRPDSERCQDLCRYLESLGGQRKGLDIVVHDVVGDLEARSELYALGRRYHTEKLGLPAIHVMDRFHVGYSDTEVNRERVAALLKIEVFTRDGCPRCRDAKEFLRDLAPRWPALEFDIREIVRDQAARDRMMKLASHYRVSASSVPAFHLCGQLKVGYQGNSITGRQIESLIRKAARSRPPGEEATATTGVDWKVPTATSLQIGTTRPFWSGVVSVSRISVFVLTGRRILLPSEHLLLQLQDPPGEFDPLPELEGSDADDIDVLPPPTDPVEPQGDGAVASEKDQGMEVPFFGKLSVGRLGMPAFTFLVGLVDGFNPCAMWVLMFLLSVLVNIKERSKILIIAGTFVVVSGLAYFAFMAAWLNVFMIVGLDRAAQVILGCVAVVIGVINVKDFFAFGEGVSLSIPDSAKPGIYARVRRIVMAKHLWAALFGAIVLAVLVNIIELLCTAGLPALYTQILTMQEYPAIVNYLYLGLYIIAYMLDDTLLVTVVVVTLSKKKLQESHGRWLKLLSGVVILALGIDMLVQPELLV